VIPRTSTSTTTASSSTSTPPRAPPRHTAGTTRLGTVGFCFGAVTFLAAQPEARRSRLLRWSIVSQRFPQFPPLVDEVPKLRTPWLGLFGDRDQSIPLEDIEQLARR
jgi:carboxymethylenebutenolidase